MSTGGSRPRTPASSSSISTPQLRADELLGRFSEALEHNRQALTIARDVGNQGLETDLLVNLGYVHGQLGEIDAATQHLRQGLALARGIGNRQSEGDCLAELADILIDDGKLDQAADSANHAVTLGEESGDTEVTRSSQTAYALAQLYAGAITEARVGADAAYESGAKRELYSVSALRGVIALRQGAREDALAAFEVAIAHAERTLAEGNSQNFAALDAKGLGLCGITLCRGEDHTQEAVAAYQAARRITAAEGVVRRTLRLFDALAPADTEERLARVRSAAAGTETAKTE